MPYHDEVVPKWNIIFLIYAELVDFTTTVVNKPNPDEDNDDDVKAAFNQLESDILKVTVSDNFNLVTIKNVVKIVDNIVISDTTYVSLLVFDDIEKKNRQETLNEFSIENFDQKSEDIKVVFRYIDENYPADKTLLITWDHGSGFGIFKKFLSDKLEQEKKLSLTSKKYVHVKNVSNGLAVVKNRKLVRQASFFKSANSFAATASNAENTAGANFDILSDDKLADAITNGFKSGYVEALIMFNCDMQNMHTCYALRNCVKYLVAPEGVIAAPGYDYVSIIDFIGKNKDLAIDGATIAVQAVNTLKQNFTDNNADSIFENIALFAVCLIGYEEKIIKHVRLLIVRLKEMMRADPSVAPDIRNTRGKSYTFGHNLHYYLVDLNNFLIKLVKTINGDLKVKIDKTQLSNLQEYLQVAYSSLIVAQAVGNNIYFDDLSNPWEKATGTLPKGVSIYFPPTAIDQNDIVVKKFLLPNAPFSSSLVASIGWLDFLSDVYKS